MSRRSCSSGSAIREGEKDKPCGKTLTILRDTRTGRMVGLCPACDRAALALACRVNKPKWEPPEAVA